MKVLARAGFDPYGASRFLAALGRSASGSDGSADMMASHPSTRERINLALQAARRASAPGVGEAGRVDYLSAIEGLAYGDDPADGVVRGRRFIHSRLGVAFEAPEGFTLENTSQAVLGRLGGRLPQAALRCRRHSERPEPRRGSALDLERHHRAGQPPDGDHQRPAGRHRSVGRQGMVVPAFGHPHRQHDLPPDHGGSDRAPGDLEGIFQRTLATVRQVQSERGARRSGRCGSRS